MQEVNQAMAHLEFAPTSEARYILGVDLGGTKIYAALATEQGQIVQTIKRPTEASNGAQHILNNVFDAIDRCLHEANITVAQLKGIGVCVPGIVDAIQGMVLDCTNLPGWHNFRVGEYLEARYGVPIAVDNDARAAAWAEASSGAGIHMQDFVYITISTGIGSGIVIGRKLYRGFSGVAGELGETRYPDGGLFEGRAAGPALKRLFNIPPEELKARYMAGDPKACAAFEHLVRELGWGLGNLVTLLNPEALIVGGGLAQMGEFLLQPLRASIRQNAYSLSRNVTLVQAHWGIESGVMGMIGHFLEN